MHYFLLDILLIQLSPTISPKSSLLSKSVILCLVVSSAFAILQYHFFIFAFRQTFPSVLLNAISIQRGTCYQFAPNIICIYFAVWIWNFILTSNSLRKTEESQ